MRLRNALLCALPLLAGCSDETSRQIGTATMFTSAADRRIVYSTPVGSETNRSQVLCAEPSPDVAKAVGTAFQFDASAQAAMTDPTTQGKIDGNLALAI